MKNRKLKILIAYNEPIKRPGYDLDYISEAGVKDEAEAVYQAILKLGHVPAYLAAKNLDQILSKIDRFGPDLIFNLCEGFHGRAQNEMYLAALWELLGIPYTGNPPLTLGLAQDKVLAKRLFQSAQILTPPYEVFLKMPEACGLDYPVIAKPSREDASLGIEQGAAILYNFDELKQRVGDLLMKYQQPILVEQFIDGREFNISILGNDPPRALAISEISFDELGTTAPHITGYEAKWLIDHPLYQKTPAICPANITIELKLRLEQIALQVYEILGGRDYGRIDTRVDADGNIFVLEYNPNPDISSEAGFVRALKAFGISYNDFVEQLIIEALKRKSNDRN
ncbi:MAG: D-alanine--D-alanine ligase [candidate division KSB1 bacterium]|nr:D-alanine--D-alanine ligase [candidate division KSB1 bacterium]MDZ7335458.1 D-alanine--D-alanine ligase [candidate division KSB1 bacterium]MDZ7358764.1 D-alanine--D-alanine ligase [candidate division KSB1 bacterium]MDZ7400296.1 D-alanine--D-alanine ligase [candidate division KSB1 bacterium]